MLAPLLLLLVSALAWDDSQPEVRVFSVEDDAIALDGSLDEGVWERAEPASGLLRHRPSKGGPPPCPTEVRFLQDDKNLYVGARVFDCDYPIRARVGAREQINEDDQIGVYFDTFGDGRSGYLFYINPQGVQQDIRTSNGEWSFSWNTAFHTRGRITEDGYEIEMAFPWRSLKYPSGESAQTWGVVITRVVPALGAKYSFPQIEDGHPRVMTLAAPLVGLEPPRSGSGLELIPTLTVGQGWPREDGSTTGLDPWHQVLRPSLDLRYGITPDIGLTGSLNPDFSQVEADVPDVRVNPRFAFQFPETRPFFLDGFEYYEDRANTLYTRSINEPLYGGKISGREGPVSIGVLSTIDRSPLPSFNASGTPGFGDQDVAGRQALNTVLRGRVDAFGNGFVGMTYADKRLMGEADRPRLSDGAGVFQGGGLDAELPIGGRWRVGGSSQHTVAGVAGDPLTWGMRNRVALQRIEQFGTGVDVAVFDITPGHRLETGFSPQSGISGASAGIDRNVVVDRFLDTIEPGIGGSVVVERDGDRLVQAGPDLELRMADVHQVSVEADWVDQVEAGVEFRGWRAAAGYSAYPVSWLQIDPSVEVGRAIDYGLLVPADNLYLSLDSSLLPITWLRLDTRASWARFDPEAPGPAGRARSATLVRERLNWQFSREVGLRVVEAFTADSLDGQQLQSSALLTWIKVPGTAAYLGVTELTDLDTGAMLQRSIFAKVSVLLRP